VTTNHYQLTSLSQTPAGLGTISVSARISGLRPRTTYHFRVIAISGFASNYAELYYAADLTFRTKPWHGALLLIGKRLHVSGQVVGARLTCSSKRRCVGRLSIGTRAQGSPVACASKSFRIGAGHRRMVEASVSQACLALLTKAPEHRLQGRFSSATTTGQRGVNTPVKLILG
jgi:hypothetical protein